MFVINFIISFLIFLNIVQFTGNIYKKKDEIVYHYTPTKERIIEFEGVNIYIIYPENFKSKELKLLVYNQGSSSALPNSLNEELPYDLLWYKDKLPKYNTLLVAGEFPGHSISAYSQRDFDILNRFLKSLEGEFTFSKKFNFLSYSAGAYFSLYYTSIYPENVRKIALIAPGFNYTDWSEENISNKFLGKEVKVWHGKLDKNISYLNSLRLFEKFSNSGIEIDLVLLEDMNHFDKLVEDRELYEFFGKP